MKDGGMAYPGLPIDYTAPDGKVINCSKGMTLRQWYAGMALSSISSWGTGFLPEDRSKFCAKEVFAIADAIIAFEESESNGK